MKKRSFKFPVIIVFLLIAAVIGFFTVVKNHEWQEYPPIITGPLVRGDTAGKSLIYYITEENRARSISRGKRYSSFTEYFSVYQLAARDAASGKLFKSVKIISPGKKTEIKGIKILGPVENGLWLWNQGPELYHPETLEPILSLEKIKIANPEYVAVLPTESDFFKVSGLHKSLIFKSLDARFLRIDSFTGKINAADEALLEQVMWRKNADDGFRYLPVTGIYLYYNHMEGNLINSFLTKNGIWHSLLSRKEKSALSKWSVRPGRPDTDGQNYYFQAPFKMDDRNQPELNPSRLKQMNDTGFLQGGFIKRGVQSVWDVPAPSSSLVMSKNILGQNGQWMLHRLGRDGNIIWSTATGLIEMGQLADGGGHVILTGFLTNQEPTRTRPQVIVWIDEKSGMRSEFSVSEQ